MKSTVKNCTLKSHANFYLSLFCVEMSCTCTTNCSPRIISCDIELVTKISVKTPEMSFSCELEYRRRLYACVKLPIFIFEQDICQYT